MGEGSDKRFRGTGAATPIASLVDGRPLGEARWLQESDFDELFALAREGALESAGLPTWRRAEILESASRRIREAGDELAELVVHECGKTIREGRDEVRRAADTLLFSGEEARRIAGEFIDFEAQYRGEGVIGWTGRFPLGVVVGASPFNSPLNLVAHKVGPAFAVGNAIVVKPSPKTPLSGAAIIDALIEAGAPKGSVLFAPCPNELALALFGHPEVDLVSFTGRWDVGWDIRRKLPEKRMVLELGSNGACIVASDALPEEAARLCVLGAMAAAGQVCASVQRVFVDQTIADRFAEAAASVAEQLVVGNPLDERTDVGPLFDEPSADRAVTLIRRAEEGGAKVLVGGEREGRFVRPCVIDHVTDDMAVACDEAFAPIMGILRYDDLNEAIRRANASPFGLQAAVFTKSMAIAMECYRQLQAGTVTVNRHHAWRVDHMPFGGWKRSGWGREGIRQAMLELSQTKVLAFDWKARV